jgi:hypothetical protein
MKLLFHISLFFLLLFTPSFSPLEAQCINRMLDFDGVDDYVQAGSPLPGVTDFTIELWYKSDNNGNSGLCDNNSLADFRWLISWGDDQFGLGDCNGTLGLVYQPACPGTTNLCSALPAVNINDGAWHHIAVVQDAVNATLAIYTDCVLLTSLSPGTYSTSGFFRLGSSGSGLQGKTWKGQMDEFRLWNVARSLTDISAHCKCTLSGDESGLVTYWTMDQGDAGADNTAVIALIDQCNNNNDGGLQNFSLGVPNNAISNFFESSAPLIEPYIGVLQLEVKDYPLVNTLKMEICDGDPVHFCLLCEGEVPSPFASTILVWEYNDGAGWLDVNDSHFTGYCFVVPATVIQASCATNVNGFTDRIYRARFDVVSTMPPLSCTQYSREYPLRICCPLGAATVDVSTNFANDWLCDGKVVNYTVTLQSSDPFVQNPGPTTTIEWFYNNASIGFFNQLNITHSATVSAATGACFKAEVKNCNIKSTAYSTCLTVDKKPLCGAIEGVSTPFPLEPDPSDPDPLDDEYYYLICPGSDAVLGMVAPAAFTDCNPVWQYSFDQISWVDLGATNSLQNTNILPSYYWSGQTVIYYRIKGLPLLWPNSGCDPCYSNLITIRLKASPTSGTIVGTNQICDGDQTILSYDQHLPGYHYQWYCNGLLVGTNSPDFTADKTACYWAEVDNGCSQKFETPKFCLKVCKIVPVISCPLPPNTGACIGREIRLSGCDSEDNCSGLLTYTWTASTGAAPVIENICEMVHTPDVAGTTYTLEVSNASTGCSKTASITIVPCPN